MEKESGYKYLNLINSPADLKKLNLAELRILVDEIRDYLVDTISKIGGHLGASLGVVELTTALHYVFNTPEDALRSYACVEQRKKLIEKNLKPLKD